jgi:multicomponent Na+:H+ antiporter subunit F
MMVVALALLTLAGIGFLHRLVIGPSVGDRVIALDGLILLAVGALAVNAARTDSAVFIDAIVVVGLLGFVATSVAGRYIEGRRQ